MRRYRIFRVFGDEVGYQGYSHSTAAAAGACNHCLEESVGEKEKAVGAATERDACINERN